jgi:hypothetical protein
MNDDNIMTITCDAARDQLALLLYGELGFDQEERIDQHLDSCAECRAALDRQRALHAAIDDLEVSPSPALLTSCRDALFETIDLQNAGAQGVHNAPLEIQGPSRQNEGWWSQVLASFEGLTTHWLRPAGAVALLAIGFMAARMIPAWGPMSAGSRNGANYSAMDLANLGAAQVRNVQEDANGRVNILLNETKQRTVSGNLQDAAIRNLLMAAAKGSDDPGLRAETVTILVNDANSSDVRNALVFSLENDQNAVVRWRAMEGLKAFTSDRAVQSALARVLQRDVNPGMRTQAIDLLTAEPSPSIDREVVGVLQETVSREDDAYVRERAQRMLEALKASAGVY